MDLIQFSISNFEVERYLRITNGRERVLMGVAFSLYQRKIIFCFIFDICESSFLVMESNTCSVVHDHMCCSFKYVVTQHQTIVFLCYDKSTLLDFLKKLPYLNKIISSNKCFQGLVSECRLFNVTSVMDIVKIWIKRSLRMIHQNSSFHFGFPFFFFWFLCCACLGFRF